MEEVREQPVVTPATALDKVNENEVVSETGSQTADLGKFKSVQALMDAYENLQSEFTKKCQLLSNYQKDKTLQAEENQNNEEKAQDDAQENDGFNQEVFKQFLDGNDEAKMYENEILERFKVSSSNQHSPYEVAWANVVLNHMKQGDKTSDPIINQYVLSDENVKNKIIENYLNDLNNSKPPITISSRAGVRVSSVKPDTPKTLAEAKRLVDKMFS